MRARSVLRRGYFCWRTECMVSDFNRKTLRWTQVYNTYTFLFNKEV